MLPSPYTLSDTWFARWLVACIPDNARSAPAWIVSGVPEEPRKTPDIRQPDASLLAVALASCGDSMLAGAMVTVFATTSTAYHGHPEPLTCPPERARRSMALYYYTNGRPDEEVQEAHSTLFQPRPGEKVRLPKRDALRRWVPPPILDWLRARKR